MKLSSIFLQGCLLNSFINETEIPKEEIPVSLVTTTERPFKASLLSHLQQTTHWGIFPYRFYILFGHNKVSPSIVLLVYFLDWQSHLKNCFSLSQYFEKYAEPYLALIFRDHFSPDWYCSWRYYSVLVCIDFDLS